MLNTNPHQGPQNSVDAEYKSLRDELQEAKRYVFERPLLIITLAVAGTRVSDARLVALALVLSSILLLFNFWFTINRLQSAARITAYIQLELKEGKIGRRIGWETCLREYRIWHNENRKAKVAMINSELKSSKAIPDGLMYYPAIYKLHVGLMVLITGATLLLLLHCNASNWFVLATGALFVLLASIRFTIDSRKWSPRQMAPLIERNRLIWIHIFNELHAIDRK